ncbi:glycosyl hydrolases family 31-domain-containing protein [Chytridium lagenaria]|nr:glycosyl hydrolases family 31-domain-containing protein [Chytridium lagenaria]
MPLTVSSSILEARAGSQRKQIQIGNFVVELSSSPARLLVRHKDALDRDLLATVPGVPFVCAAMGEDDFTEGYGTFKIIDHDFYMTETQSIDVFQLKTDDDGDIEERYHKVFLKFASTPEERFFGFGEQLTHFDLKGHKIPIMVREDGVGRGVQPVTAVTNLVFGPYAGGDAVSAYKPVPFFVTSKLRCLFLESNDYSMFDLTDPDRVTIKIAAPLAVGRLIYGKSPLNIVEEYTSYAGRMEPLPDWALEGVIAGIQGGEEKVLGIVKKMQEAGVPLAALWLQDWCGKREQRVLGRILKRLWWNWESDPVLYPNWPTFVKNLEKQNIHMLTYVNSFLADVELGGKPTYGRNLYKEALDKNYLVKDETGEHPLSISSGPNFRAGLVDLFNLDAFEWLKNVMVDQVFKEPGVKGYMSDFAEFLPPGTYLSDGLRRRRRIIIITRKDGRCCRKGCWRRSGFTRSPGITRLFWTGDQLVSWDGCDGIKAGLNHSDVGGYSGLMLNLLACALGTGEPRNFCLDGWSWEPLEPCLEHTREVCLKANAQFYDDKETLAHMARCAKIFASLKAYKKILMDQAAAWGYPMISTCFSISMKTKLSINCKNNFC